MATTIGSLDLNAFSDLYSGSTQYFWFESNATATYGAGAHVTLVPDTSFISNPTGQNILMNTDGFSIRNGLLPMMTLDNNSLDFNVVDTTAGTYVTTSTFTATGAQIGQSGAAHSVIDADGQRFYGGSDGTTQLANIGYGEGAAQSSIEISPYYTFGLRQTTTTAYSSSSTYAVGDVCVYDEKVYVCIYAITTPESWKPSHWRYCIGNYSVAEGIGIRASGYVSHAEGIETTTSGDGSHAEGYSTKAIGRYAHAEGDGTIAKSFGAHAEGVNTTAGFHIGGSGAHAEGVNTFAYDTGAHAEGSGSITYSTYCHAEGYQTWAGSPYDADLGSSAHSEGYSTKAMGTYSHAEGYYTYANGTASHAQNYYTAATEQNQTVIGKYNAATVTGSGTTSNPYVYTDAGDYAFIIGNGTDNTTADRSNALTVDWKGGIQMYLDSNGTSSSAATSGDDMDLFNAIYNLGLYSSVIV